MQLSNERRDAAAKEAATLALLKELQRLGREEKSTEFVAQIGPEVECKFSCWLGVRA